MAAEYRNGILMGIGKFNIKTGAGWFQRVYQGLQWGIGGEL